MKKIFIIEDDTTIARLVQKHLLSWGYQANTAQDFQNVLTEFENYKPDLVLLDISLPFFNGYHWCTEIRKISDIPIVFLTSVSDNINIVMAMNMGADDYITKPFDLNVLTAKLSAIFRRVGSPKTNYLEHLGLKLHNYTMEYNSQTTELSKNEYKIMEILMQNPDKVMSRESIITILWDSENFVDDNTLTVNITRIRKKLSILGLENFIKTKKGVGYYV